MENVDGTQPSANRNKTPDSPLSDLDSINSVHLQSLMDIGFSRELCLDALNHTSVLEEATEYLLSNPPPLSHVQVSEEFFIFSLIFESFFNRHTDEKMPGIYLSKYFVLFGL